jgi:hypothetical protein
VEDLKLSHVYTKVVDNTITWLKSIYGEDMRVYRGKKHDYLGIYLDYSVPGEVKVTMVDYLKRVITEFPEEITGTASSPAAERLVTIRPDGESVLLEEKRAIAFHHCVAQLILHPHALEKTFNRQSLFSPPGCESQTKTTGSS